MMWLGIVLHSAMVYMEPRNPLHGAPETSALATSLLAWIHVFRMPVFFMMAGFFIMLLLERKGASGALRNRGLRLGLPFAIFWPLLFVAINVIIMAHAVKSGADPSGVTLDRERWVVSTGHMWFLYYLAIFTLLFVPLNRLTGTFLPALVWDKLFSAFVNLSRTLRGLALLSAPGIILSRDYPLGVMSGDGSFFPAPSSLLYYGVFYLFGAAFYTARNALIGHFRKGCWYYLAGGLLLLIGANFFGFAQMGVLHTNLNDELISLGFRTCYSIATWLWSFFFLGLFLRYVDTENEVLRYFADSSYWVYLSHYPVVLLLAYGFYGIQLGALQKMTLVAGLTTLICLCSYQLLVRRRLVGRILNGSISKQVR